MKYLKKIPETSLEKYISGYEALNTPDSSGVPADWHPRLYWYSKKEGEVLKLYNNTKLGNRGIEERYIPYINKKVFIANHPRAIADLVMLTNNLDTLTGCVDDFAFDEEQKRELLMLLLEVGKYKDIEWFIKYELTKLYFEYKRGKQL